MLQVRLRFPMNHVPRRSKIIIASAGIGILLLGLLTRCFRRRFLDLRTAFANGEVGHALRCSRCGGPRWRALQGPTSSPVDGVSAANLGPHQLATMGLDALDQALNYWEQAVQRLHAGDTLPGGGGRLCTDLELLVCEGQWLRGRWRQLLEGGPLALPPSNEEEARPPRPASAADTDSFVSAQGSSAGGDDVAVLSDLEMDALYKEALLLVQKGGVPCRTYRVEVVRCSSRQDYLAKIHCIRLAFKRLTMQPAILQWLIEAANHVLGAFLLCAGKVVCPTLYDVVIDYVLLDAFDDLSSPPQSVVAVIQNRWLTSGFKETALSAAIWSLFKAKRSLLPFSRGFFTHYYAVMEQIVPVLAWGFLGTDAELKSMCNYFKDEVEALVCDMFDASRSRYTSVDDLAQDILHNSQLHYDRLCQALEGALLPDPPPCS
ncbi:mitoguardin-like isoform X9 [Haemaphysalis longicornis]